MNQRSMRNSLKISGTMEKDMKSNCHSRKINRQLSFKQNEAGVIAAETKIETRSPQTL